MKFYSPYQFIDTKNVSHKLTEFKAIEEGETHIRHDRWQQNTCSGRIICQLKTITPIMVGAKQTVDPEKKASTQLENYRVPQQPEGRLAIPGNTIRGMVGSIIESISGSSMRVLTDQHYSVRKQMEDSLRAMGQVIKDSNGKYSILPLALVTAAQDKKGNIDFSGWKQVFKNTPLSECLAAYIGNYKKSNNSVAGKALSQWCSFNTENPEYVYARRNKNLLTLDMSEEIDLTTFGAQLHTTSKGKPMLAGQQLCKGDRDSSALISTAAYEELSENKKAEYQRGILYILGIEDRDSNMPKTKKHDLFIPFDKQSLEGRTSISLSDDVIIAFNSIANDCAQSDPALPFVPQGHKKTAASEGKPVNFIEEGDLVYFATDHLAKNVTEISFSAIWRSKISRTCHSYFSKHAGDPNILPWGDEQRDSLTPAESLLGAVENSKNEQTGHNRSLASRVSFYDAFSLEPIERLPETTLKILSSPKPPSPVMYFHKAKGRSISKSELNSDSVLPNGRKRYLHHRQAIKGNTWRTADDTDLANLKIKCRPMDRGQKFYFHIDFNNLKKEELNLLLTAIEPALNCVCADENKHFMHKIGLGKPLGLGSAEVQVAGVYLIDRQERYTSSAIKQTSRYSRVQLGRHFAWPEPLAVRYGAEHKARLAAENSPQTENIADLMDAELIDKDALKTLFNLGCIESLLKKNPVCYPFSLQQGQRPGEEGEGFKWFSEKDQNNNLGCADADKIPVLNARDE